MNGHKISGRVVRALVLLGGLQLLIANVSARRRWAEPVALPDLTLPDFDASQDFERLLAGQEQTVKFAQAGEGLNGQMQGSLRLGDLGRGHELGSYEFDVFGRPVRSLIYKIPSWPFAAQPFEQGDLVQGKMAFSLANGAYNNDGKAENLAHWVFGKQVLFGDIALASRLAKVGKLDTNSASVAGANGHNLALLADTPVAFDASIRRFTSNLSYARHIGSERLTVGIQVPLVYQSQSLRVADDSLLKSKVSPGAWAANSELDNKKMSDLVGGILEEKKLVWQQQTEAGLGDMNLFGHYALRMPLLERAIVGGRVLCTTAPQNSNRMSLWPVSLGETIQPKAFVFASGLYAHNRFVNLHAFAEAGVGFMPSKITRRADHVLDKIGKEQSPSGLPGAQVLPLGQYVGMTSQHIAQPSSQYFGSLPESTVPGFGTAPVRLKLKNFSGWQCSARVGNIIENFFSPSGFLDLGYKFGFKGVDKIAGIAAQAGKKQETGEEAAPTVAERDRVDISSWLRERKEISQSLVATYSYQFNNQYRLLISSEYAFAGRNSPQQYEISGAFNIEF